MLLPADPVQRDEGVSDGSSATRRFETVIVWFRRDLRIADHPALTEAVARARVVVPLFVLDDRLLGVGTGPHVVPAAVAGRRWMLRCARAAAGCCCERAGRSRSSPRLRPRSERTSCSRRGM